MRMSSLPAFSSTDRSRVSNSSSSVKSTEKAGACEKFSASAAVRQATRIPSENTYFSALARQRKRDPLRCSPQSLLLGVRLVGHCYGFFRHYTSDDTPKKPGPLNRSQAFLFFFSRWRAYQSPNEIHIECLLPGCEQQ